jgi:hypothetical protein
MISLQCLPKNIRSAPSCRARGAVKKGHPFMKSRAVRSWGSTLLLASLGLAGCYTHDTRSSEWQSLTPARAIAVEEGVRAFAQTVANDVTQEGPLAWRKYFDPTPVFFMAVNGQMAFPNGAAAKEGIQNVALTIKHIELKWGDDLRVDPLTPELAVVAVPWREIQVDAAGHRTEEVGFFTGLAEYREGRWLFRDAHWSAPVSPSPVH